MPTRAALVKGFRLRAAVSGLYQGFSDGRITKFRYWLCGLFGMDYVLTWNMRHIANEDSRQRLRVALEKRNIVCPKLATPLELLGD